MARIEIELEACLASGVDPLAFANACLHAAAVTVGHYYRVQGNGDAHFADRLGAWVVRFLEEADRHRRRCAEDGHLVCVPEDLTSQLTH